MDKQTLELRAVCGDEEALRQLAPDWEHEKEGGVEGDHLMLVRRWERRGAVVHAEIALRAGKVEALITVATDEELLDPAEVKALLAPTLGGQLRMTETQVEGLLTAILLDVTCDTCAGPADVTAAVMCQTCAADDAKTACGSEVEALICNIATLFGVDYRNHAELLEGLTKYKPKKPSLIEVAMAQTGLDWTWHEGAKEWRAETAKGCAVVDNTSSWRAYTQQGGYLGRGYWRGSQTKAFLEASKCIRVEEPRRYETDSRGYLIPDTVQGRAQVASREAAAQETAPLTAWEVQRLEEAGYSGYTAKGVQTGRTSCATENKAAEPKQVAWTWESAEAAARLGNAEPVCDLAKEYTGLEWAWVEISEEWVAVTKHGQVHLSLASPAKPGSRYTSDIQQAPTYQVFDNKGEQVDGGMSLFSLKHCFSEATIGLGNLSEEKATDRGPAEALCVRRIGEEMAKQEERDKDLPTPQAQLAAVFAEKYKAREGGGLSDDYLYVFAMHDAVNEILAAREDKTKDMTWEEAEAEARAGNGQPIRLMAEAATGLLWASTTEGLLAWNTESSGGYGHVRVDGYWDAVNSSKRIQRGRSTWAQGAFHAVAEALSANKKEPVGWTECLAAAKEGNRDPLRNLAEAQTGMDWTWPVDPANDRFRMESVRGNAQVDIDAHWVAYPVKGKTTYGQAGNIQLAFCAVCEAFKRASPPRELVWAGAADDARLGNDGPLRALAQEDTGLVWTGKYKNPLFFIESKGPGGEGSVQLDGHWFVAHHEGGNSQGLGYSVREGVKVVADFLKHESDKEPTVWEVVTEHHAREKHFPVELFEPITQLVREETGLNWTCTSQYRMAKWTASMGGWEATVFGTKEKWAARHVETGIPLLGDTVANTEDLHAAFLEATKALKYLSSPWDVDKAAHNSQLFAVYMTVRTKVVWSRHRDEHDKLAWRAHEKHWYVWVYPDSKIVLHGRFSSQPLDLDCGLQEAFDKALLLLEHNASGGAQTKEHVIGVPWLTKEGE